MSESLNISFSGSSLNKMKERIIDYIRDVKNPLHKRSVGHLLQEFSKFDELLVTKAITTLIEENILISKRNGGMVGAHSDVKQYENSYTNKNYFDSKDWVIYNPYPKPNKE